MTPRKMIAADLDRRADALFAAIDKMTTTSERSACYIAGTAMRVAAEQTRRGIEFRPDAPTALVVDLKPRKLHIVGTKSERTGYDPAL
jgi:hypothetical protein